MVQQPRRQRLLHRESDNARDRPEVLCGPKKKKKTRKRTNLQSNRRRIAPLAIDPYTAKAPQKTVLKTTSEKVELFSLPGSWMSKFK